VKENVKLKFLQGRLKLRADEMLDGRAFQGMLFKVNEA